MWRRFGGRDNDVSSASRGVTRWLWRGRDEPRCKQISSLIGGRDCAPEGDDRSSPAADEGGGDRRRGSLGLGGAPRGVKGRHRGTAGAIFRGPDRSRETAAAAFLRACASASGMPRCVRVRLRKRAPTEQANVAEGEHKHLQVIIADDYRE